MTKEYNTAEKQAYLCQQIIGVGYDAQSFVEYMEVMKGIFVFM